MEQKQLNDLVFMQYNLGLRHNQLLNKRPDTNPIMLEDIDPSSEWVVEIQPAKFESDFDIEVEDELGWDALDANPLVATPRDTSADPDITGSGGTSTSSIRRPSHAACASTRVVYFPKGQSSKEYEPDVDVEHSISSNVFEFDD